MAISDEYIQRLLNTVDIESVVSPYVNLRRRGRVFTGLCPFHNEKTPSFTVYPETNSFYCFGCGAAGSTINFVQKIENLDYVEAIKSLSQRAGMQMPEDGYDDSLSKRRMRILSANREAAKFYNSILSEPRGEKVLQYLLGRGLTLKTITHFGMGCAPDSWDDLKKHLNSMGFSNEELYEANLVSRSEKNGKILYFDRFRNRAMTPIIDLRGNVVAFGGRVLDDSKPKYINTSDTLVYKKGRDIFALNFAKNTGSTQLILTEGYMDAIALYQYGFKNAVAGLGTALTREQAQLLSRYADEVVLAYDADEAGIKAKNRAIEILSSTGIKIRVLNLTGGKDPDEILRKYGRERFLSLLEGASNDIEYKLLAQREKFDLSTPNGKLEFLREAVKVLADLDGAIERDIYISKLSEEMNVSKDAIQQQVNELRSKRKRYKERERVRELKRESSGEGDRLNPARNVNLRAAKAEERLITILLNSPEFFGKISQSIRPEDFVTDFNRHIFTVIYNRLSEQRSVDLPLLTGDFSDDEMSRATKLSLQGRGTAYTVAECNDCINVIKQESDKKTGVKLSELSNEEFLNLFKKGNT
ncbi:MAG: DNA primase [Clostridiales bacterium]|nr:DNA primase [Clostridiales bacterium]